MVCPLYLCLEALVCKLVVLEIYKQAINMVIDILKTVYTSSKINRLQ